MASKLRNENQIKVKQPLKYMYINGNDDVSKAVELYRDIIESELNIKNVVMEHDNSKFNIELLNLDFRKAGAVLKGDVQKVKNYLVNATSEEMASYVAGYKAGSVNIKEFTNLASEIFTLATKAKEEFVVANENNLTVVLDITLDRDLMLEGLSRELIRSAQVMRKSADFKVEDRIDIMFTTDSEELKEIIEKFSEKIKAELLARSISNFDNAEYSETVEISEEKITISLKR
jgi:isoleucyl-tRNA synthetase